MAKCAILNQVLSGPALYLKPVVSVAEEFFDEVLVFSDADKLARTIADDMQSYGLVIFNTENVPDLLTFARLQAQLSLQSSLMTITDVYHTTKYFHTLSRAGVKAIVGRTSASMELAAAISKINAGESYLDPEFAPLIQQKQSSELAAYKLSDRDFEVLIRLDMRNKEIAEELDVKLRTVELCLESILHKLQAPTRTTAALMAVRMGCVLLPKCNFPGK